MHGMIDINFRRLLKFFCVKGVSARIFLKTGLCKKKNDGDWYTYEKKQVKGLTISLLYV